MRSTVPVLSVAGLTTSFMRERQWIPVVRNVSFEIAPRETVAIVGESGSGKSVTALSIMRLTAARQQPRSRAAIMLDGRDLLTLPEDEMRQVRGNDDRDDLPGADDEPQSGAHASATRSPRR